ncbi:TetR/AcrR family transcriptional regulator [Bacillus sp. ISL-34]|uniref:TetR/AcrR family transcriptional regulator n=1 Tax=Bacillus sp. ISL-34 TaxID=2819121 RepID=UPI001BEA5063|nr:TetR/AcrR family transcriptional regulator [Bacillus sp. ISL-34]MBT2646828.1 TetR/AcrR family transcriptional regulator [Bacillus sp. ISL-34]
MMNNRRQNVIDTAHKLFIDKGYQATSIQDILDGSGISKGTFYNYFPSKGELFIAIFRSFYTKIRHAREKLLIGQDSADIEIFIQQLELQMMVNKQSKLLILIEEVRVSNDEELKQFINKTLLLSLRWMYTRFLDIFGESKNPYLLDSVIIFHSMMTHMNHFSYRANAAGTPDIQIIRYCMNRIVHIVDEVAESGEQIIDPELMDTWFPNFTNQLDPCHNDLLHSTTELKKAINKAFPCDEDRTRAIELVDFIQDELMQSDKPRKFLIESLLLTLKTQFAAQVQAYIESFEESINSCLSR